VAAILSVDLEAEPVPGTPYAESTGFADLLALPDLSSLRLLRHEPRTALVLCDASWPDGRPVESYGRGVLARVAAGLEPSGLRAMAAPELEFHILDEQHRPLDTGTQAYSMQRRHTLLTEEQALLDAVAAHGELEASGKEYGPGQYEVSVRYDEIRRAADFGHLFRATMKEVAYDLGRRVTFMAKPFDEYEGNSCHVHLSLAREDGSNAFAAPDQEHHISDTCRHFIGGLLAHLDELTAILLPYANSYRRLVPLTFAPVSRAWGIDNRTAAIRLLNETGAGTRLEIRVAGGDVNLYLGLAGLLAAGIDGLRNKIDPGPPATGYLGGQDLPRLTREWSAALDAFDRSAWVRSALGDEFCRVYSLIKRHEYDKFARRVTDNERALAIDLI
jgi:glutamine synthetase